MHPRSRRYFLAAAAATTRLSKAAASDTVRIGVIGLGGRGTHLMTKEVPRIPNAKVTHLCEVDQSRLEKAQTAADRVGFGKVRGSEDMRRVFDDKEVDAVIIATPDHWHAPAAILACAAGKDVYVEKPVSHNLREGRLLVNSARQFNRVVQAGMQSRSRPSTIRAIEVVRSGVLGNVLMAKAWNAQLRDDIGKQADSRIPPGVSYDTWVGPADMVPFNANRFHYKWHWNWNFGTGDMGNDGAHQIDQARWALDVGLPQRVSGSGAKYYFQDDQQTPDTMNLAFDYGKKGLVWEMRIWHDYGLEGIDNGVAVYGTNGFLHIGRWGGSWGYRIFDKSGKKVTEYQDQEPDFHMRNFIDCVQSRQRPNCDIEIGHLSSAVCHLGNIVHRTGRNLAFDAQTESIVGDPEAAALLTRKYRKHWGSPDIRAFSGKL
jgi:predicted dehydrogenase